MSKRWIKNALSREDVEIVALVDINPAAAEAMAAEYNLTCARFTNLEEAIRSTNANLVMDVTIPEVHKSVVLTATALGCDVLGEKPMAASMKDAADMKAFVAEHNQSYAVMQNRRYTKQIREARGLIEQGVIGQPGFIKADFFLGPHFGGFRDAMDNPLILDMAIHTFDQARFLLKADPVSVYCHEFNPPHSWYRGNASAICIFELSDGSVFSYNGSWCAEGASTSWESAWRIMGSKGTLIWDGTNTPYAEVLPAELVTGAHRNECLRVEPTAEWTGREGHDGCFDEMFASLIEGRKAETDCSDNLNSMAMVFGAIESAKRGEKVLISSVM
ncbi:Gfo/Idh/MocA family protein [Paenibacillus agricola]|nr:Gfo/Idh/MocA family oxidoreductase [Paenibacillus agricola]